MVQIMQKIVAFSEFMNFKNNNNLYFTFYLKMHVEENLMFEEALVPSEDTPGFLSLILK